MISVIVNCSIGCSFSLFKYCVMHDGLTHNVINNSITKQMCCRLSIGLFRPADVSTLLSCQFGALLFPLTHRLNDSAMVCWVPAAQQVPGR